MKQVTPEHISSPRKRHKYWSKAMEEIEVLKKKVKILQEKNRRLVKRVNTFKSMMSHLGDKLLLSESASDTVTVF